MTQPVRVIEISSCSSCPFFERSIASFVADWMAKRSANTGMCKHNAGGKPFPFGRIHVEEPDGQPPDKCPLREHPTKIELIRKPMP